jgi:transcription termination/antitermination protein NusG
MSSVAVPVNQSAGVFLSAPGQLEPRWYAVCTRARHEKRVAANLEQKGLEHFLPLYETLSQWKDRRARVCLPLFPGYVFVHFPLQQRMRVLDVPSVASIVSFNGKPAPLADSEIDRLRGALAGSFLVEPHPYLRVGRRVRVLCGPLAGLEGILVRKKGGTRLVVSIDLIMRSVSLEIDAAHVEPAPQLHCRSHKQN